MGKLWYVNYTRVHAKSLQLCLTLGNPMNCIAHRAALSKGFSRQQYWSGLPCPPPGDLPNVGIEPETFLSPALAGGFFTTSATYFFFNLFFFFFSQNCVHISGWLFLEWRCVIVCYAVMCHLVLFLGPRHSFSLVQGVLAAGGSQPSPSVVVAFSQWSCCPKVTPLLRFPRQVTSSDWLMTGPKA